LNKNYGSVRIFVKSFLELTRNVSQVVTDPGGSPCAPSRRAPSRRPDQLDQPAGRTT